MGGVTQGARRGRPLLRRRDPHLGPGRPASPPGTAASPGSSLEAGEELTARRRRRPPPTRRSRSSTWSTGADLPADFVADIERWKTRSGTVKVNLAVDRLPEFTCRPGFDPEVHGGTIVLAESLDDIEGAFQDAVAGRPVGAAVRRHLHPLVFDQTLAPEGHHVVSMFTQWVPHTWADASRWTRSWRPTPTGWSPGWRRSRPGFTDSILHRQVIGPYEMEHEYGLVGGNIFHGELTPGQLFHAPPGRRLRRPPHPDRRPLPGRVGHPRRRRRHRHPRPQRRPPDLQGPPPGRAAQQAPPAAPRSATR